MNMQFLNDNREWYKVWANSEGLNCANDCVMRANNDLNRSLGALYTLIAAYSHMCNDAVINDISDLIDRLEDISKNLESIYNT